VNSTTPMLVSSRHPQRRRRVQRRFWDGRHCVLRAVDRDFDNAVGFVVEDIFVGFGGLPVDFHGPGVIATLACEF